MSGQDDTRMPGNGGAERSTGGPIAPTVDGRAIPSSAERRRGLIGLFQRTARPQLSDGSPVPGPVDGASAEPEPRSQGFEAVAPQVTLSAEDAFQRLREEHLRLRSMVSEIDRSAEMLLPTLRGEVEELRKAAAVAAEVVDTETGRLERLISILARHARNLFADVDQRTWALREAADQAATIAERVNGVFTAHAAQAGGAAERADALLAALWQVEHAMRMQVSMLDETALKAVALSERSTELLRDQKQAASSGLDAIAAQAAQAREAMLADAEQMGSVLVAKTERTRETLAALAEDVERRLAKAGQSVLHAVEGVLDAGQCLEVRNRDLAEISTAAAERLSSLGECVAGQIDTVGQAVERMLGETGLVAMIDGLTGRLEQACREIAGLDQQFAAGVGRNQERLRISLAAARDTVQILADDTVARVDALLRTLETRAERLGHSMADAGLVAMMEDLARNLDAARDRLDGIDRHFAVGAAAVTERVQGIGNLVDARLAALEAGAVRAGRSMAEAGAVFLAQAGAVADCGMQASGHIDHAADALEMRGRRLAEFADTVVQHLETSAAGVEARTGSLRDAVARAVAEIGDAGRRIGETEATLDGLSQRVVERLHHVDTSLAAVGAAVESEAANRLQTVERMVGTLVQHAANALSATGARMETLCWSLDQTAARTLARITEAENAATERLDAERQRLAREAERLDAERRRLSEEADRLARREAELRKAEQDMARRRGEVLDLLAAFGRRLRTPAEVVLRHGQQVRDAVERLHAWSILPETELIVWAGEQLLGTIDPGLVLVRMMADAAVMCLDDVDPVALAEQLCRRVEPVAELHANRLEVDVPPDLGTFRCDGAKLTTILDCLLNNACTHTEGGDVRLSMARAEIDGRQVMRITVADTGPGLTEVQKSLLLQSFCPTDGAAGSLGLAVGSGLAMAGRFSALLGGRIGVATGPEGGTIITLSLPVTDAASPVHP